MKRVVGLASVAAVAALVIPLARSLEVPAVPPGVDAGNWISLGDAFGFAIDKDGTAMGSVAAVGVLKGTFMVRRSSTWFRVDPAPAYGLRPAMTDH